MYKKSRPLLTIGIPTFNRCLFLKRSLDSIVAQIGEFKYEVEICISDNNSTDNTEEVVSKFREKYPSIIRYNINKDNLGFDRNLLKVISMAKGKFIWLLGDDDQIAKEGLRQVIKLIRERDKLTLGMIIGRRKSFFINKRTGEKTVYEITVDVNKPEIFKIDRDKIIDPQFTDSAFISVQIFNNFLVKQTINRNQSIIEKGIGTGFIHTLIYRLMFLKCNWIKGYILNKIITYQEMSYYKNIIESSFILLCGKEKIEDLLLLSAYPETSYNNIISTRKSNHRKRFLIDMGLKKAFNILNYNSYIGCIQLFIKHSSFLYGLTLITTFTILLVIPSSILKIIYKILYKIKYGNSWKSKWIKKSIIFSNMSRGERIQII